MAHPYTTRARMDALIRPSRLRVLLDVDQDEVEDDGVFDDAIERAANRVDADLARMYVVPFSLSPATSGIIADLTDYCAAALLFRLGGAPMSEDAREFEKLYEGLLNRILGGRSAVPGATPVPADEGAVAMVYSAEAPTFSGSNSSGTRRSTGLF